MPPNTCLAHSSLAHLQITLIPQGHNTDNFIISGCTRCCLLTTLDATSDDKIVHYSDVITSMMASQFTSISIVCLNVCSGTDQRQYQSSVSLAFVRESTGEPVDSPHKVQITWKMFSFDDVIMVIMVTWDVGLLETAFVGLFGWF